MSETSHDTEGTRAARLDQVGRDVLKFWSIAMVICVVVPALVAALALTQFALSDSSICGISCLPMFDFVFVALAIAAMASGIVVLVLRAGTATLTICAAGGTSIALVGMWLSLDLGPNSLLMPGAIVGAAGLALATGAALRLASRWIVRHSTSPWTPTRSCVERVCDPSGNQGPSQHDEQAQSPR